MISFLNIQMLEIKVGESFPPSLVMRLFLRLFPKLHPVHILSTNHHQKVRGFIVKLYLHAVFAVLLSDISAFHHPMQLSDVVSSSDSIPVVGLLNDLHHLAASHLLAKEAGHGREDSLVEIIRQPLTVSFHMEGMAASRPGPCREWTWSRTGG